MTKLVVEEFESYLKFHSQIYSEADSQAQALVTHDFTNLLSCTALPFSNDTFPAHITASAVITDSFFNSVLLTHHKKLGIWIQLGGHCDGSSDVFQSAKREAMEESGYLQIESINWPASLCSSESVKALNHLSVLPFDFDIHLIPENKKTREHFHYDVRYLFWCDSQIDPVVSEESFNVKWVSLSEIERFVLQDPSMLRIARKLNTLKSTGKFKFAPGIAPTIR